MNTHYLVTSGEDLKQIESKIERLSKHVNFSCKRDGAGKIFPADIFVKRKNGQEFDYLIMPFFSGDKLYFGMNLQNEDEKKPVIDSANSERVDLIFDGNYYSIYFNQQRMDI